MLFEKYPIDIRFETVLTDPKWFGFILKKMMNHIRPLFQTHDRWPFIQHFVLYKRISVYDPVLRMLVEEIRGFTSHRMENCSPKAMHLIRLQRKIHGKVKISDFFHLLNIRVFLRKLDSYSENPTSR